MEEKNINVDKDESINGDASGENLVDRYKAVKKKRRNIILIVTAAFLFIVAVISVTVYFVNKASYRSTVDDFMDAYIAEDSSTILEMSSSFYTARKQHNISILETVNYFKKVVNNAHATFEANLGETYEISYEITAADKMRDEEFESMLQSLTFGAYNPSLIITDAVRVEITVTAEAETSLTHVITLLLTKEDGEWYVLDIK